MLTDVTQHPNLFPVYCHGTSSHNAILTTTLSVYLLLLILPISLTSGDHDNVYLIDQWLLG